LQLQGIPWFSEATSTKGLAEGGIYLLSGTEGSGKTNLALQMCVDLAIQGYKILYLALEQAPSALKHRIENLILPDRWEKLEKNYEPNTEQAKQGRSTDGVTLKGLDQKSLRSLEKRMAMEEKN